jgi:hypothetical protein
MDGCIDGGMAGGMASSTTTILPPNGPSSHWTHRHTHTRSLSLSHIHLLSNLLTSHQPTSPALLRLPIPSNTTRSHSSSFNPPSKHIQSNPLRSAIRSTCADIPPPHPSTSRMNPPANLPSRPHSAFDAFRPGKLPLVPWFFFWGGGWKKKRIRREREREVWGGKAKGEKRKIPEPGACTFVCCVATSLCICLTTLS